MRPGEPRPGTTSAAEGRLCECARYAYLVGAHIDEARLLTWEGEPVRTDCDGGQTKAGTLGSWSATTQARSLTP